MVRDDGGRDRVTAPRGAPVGAQRLALLLVFLLALFVRLAYLLEIRGTPLTQLLVLDADTYDRFARRILAGTFRGEDVYAMNALYPYFVALGYKLAHGSTFAVLVAQAVLDAATCTLTAWMGARLVAPIVGVLAGALVALAAPLVFYTGALLTPTLLTFLVTAGTAALVAWGGGRRARWALLAGLAFGLATLGRGNYALMVPLAWGVFAWAGGRGAGGAWAPWSLFLAAWVVPVAAIAARNWTATGAWVPVAANYAAFYVGHNAAANGVYVAPPWIVGAEFQQEVWGVRDAVARQVGHPVTLAESARWLFAQALAFARTHPADELRLAVVKFRFFVSGIEAPTNLNLEFARDWSPLLARLPVGWTWLAPLGAAGAVCLSGRARMLAPLYASIGVALVTTVAVFAASEYRVPCVPALAVLAAAGIVVPGVRGRWIGPAIAGVLVLVLALERPRVLAEHSDKSGDDVNFGTLYARRDEWVAARVLYERGIATDPANGFAWRGLAVALDRLGDPRGAATAAAEARRLGALPPLPAATPMPPPARN
jgi:4-amino-4-deoxy-L-arabinose transferase-like glycosyltransferase